nr:unnamed protein product [Spirometra erinaceieuropaei]
MAIDNKFFKGMYLESLPTSVQTISASGSDDLHISKLEEMTDRMMEVERLLSPTVSKPLTVSTPDLAELKTQIAQSSVTVATLQLRRSPGPSPSSFGRDRRCSRSRTRAASLCWNHVNYGDKARRCVPPCSFKSTQGNASAGDKMLLSSLATLRVAPITFNYVHLHIVCPLTLSNDFSYLLTCVDLFTPWPEAIPMPKIAAPMGVQASRSRWAAIFGALSTVTTDRAAQSESNLFQSLLSFLGCTRIRTTTYHPAANGMVIRFHRQQMASVRAAADPENRTDHIPLVLLGIRSDLKPDLDCSAAELMLTTVRLPFLGGFRRVKQYSKVHKTISFVCHYGQEEVRESFSLSLVICIRLWNGLLLRLFCLP